MVTIYVDFLKEEKIGRITGRILHQLTGKLEQTIEIVKNTLKGVNITIKDTTVELGFESDEELLLRVLDIIEKKSQKSEGILIVFDEFQELNNIAPNSIKKIRATIQHHSKVSYIFTGSDSKLIELFTNVEEPFYKFGKSVTLTKPNESEMVEFIIDRFKDTNISITKQQADYILTKSENLPYFTQLISQELWIYLKLENKTKTSSTDIDHVFEYILSQEKNNYEAVWSKLKPSQRKALKIIIESKQIFKAEIIAKYKLSQGSLQQSIKFLLKEQLISKENGKFTFLDPILKLWIKRRYLD